jgi:hypothetical protein
MSVLLNGCGTTVPEISEFWEGPGGTEELEFNIKRAVYCDLRNAIRSVSDIQETVNGKPVDFLPGDWGAQITLSLEVDESTGVSPGATLTEPIVASIKTYSNGTFISTPQSFSLGFGGTLSSQALRTDKFNMFYLVSDMRRQIDPENDVCNDDKDKRKGSSWMLTSDLRIPEWLHGAMLVDHRLDSSVGAGSSSASPKPDTVSFEIKFIVISSGNVTPSWKLVRVTSDTSQLLSVNRTRTHDLIITIGPTTGAGGQRTSYLHLSSQIGSATSGSLRPLFQ